MGREGVEMLNRVVEMRRDFVSNCLVLWLSFHAVF